MSSEPRYCQECGRQLRLVDEKSLGERKAGGRVCVNRDCGLYGAGT